MKYNNEELQRKLLLEKKESEQTAEQKLHTFLALQKRLKKKIQSAMREFTDAHNSRTAYERELLRNGILSLDEYRQANGITQRQRVDSNEPFLRVVDCQKELE